MLRSIKYWLLHKYQRLTRGWSDDQTWNIDYELAKWLVPRLKAYKKMNNGYPSHLTPAKWNKMISEIIKGQELRIRSMDDISFERYEEEITKADELLGKHLKDLWW